MKIKVADTYHQIEKLKLTDNHGAYDLAWRVNAGEFFLVFFYDANKKFELEEMISLLNNNRVDDKSIIDSQDGRIYSSDGGKLIVRRFSSEEYQRNNFKVSFERKELEKNSAYQIIVYSCSIEDDEVVIYKPEDESWNSTSRPIEIPVTISVKNKLFSSKRVYEIMIPMIDGYEDGAIVYTIDSARHAYPITTACLQQPMHIEVEKSNNVSLKVIPKYAKIYKVKNIQN